MEGELIWGHVTFACLFGIFFKLGCLLPLGGRDHLIRLGPLHQHRAWHRAGAHENVFHVIVTLKLIREGTVLEIHTSMAPHHCDYNIYLIVL